MSCQFGALLAHDNGTEQFLTTLKQYQSVYSRYHGYICTVLCSYGIIANSVNILVLTRPSMRTAVNILLAVIALCDMGTMLTYLVYVLHVQVLSASDRCHSDVYSRGWLYFILFHQHWSILLHTTSLWLAVFMALVRLLVIRRCRIASTLMLPKTIVKSIVSICLSLTVCMIPIGALNRVVNTGPDTTCTSNVNATTYNVVLSQAAMVYNCLLLRVVLWISGLVFKLIPCILLTFLIGALLRSYHKAQERNERIMKKPTTYRKSVRRTSALTSAWRRISNPNMSLLTKEPRRRSEPTSIANSSSPGPSRRVTNCDTTTHHQAFTSRTTTMLTLILLTFLITETPQAIVAVLGGIYPNDMYHVIYPLLGDLFDLLSLINSSVNFVLYCAMSSRFRATFKEIIWSKYRRSRSLSSKRARRSRMMVQGIGLNMQLGLLATPRFKRYTVWRTKRT